MNFSKNHCPVHKIKDGIKLKVRPKFTGYVWLFGNYKSAVVALVLFFMLQTYTFMLSFVSFKMHIYLLLVSIYETSKVIQCVHVLPLKSGPGASVHHQQSVYTDPMTLRPHITKTAYQNGRSTLDIRLHSFIHPSILTSTHQLALYHHYRTLFSIVCSPRYNRHNV